MGSFRVKPVVMKHKTYNIKIAAITQIIQRYYKYAKQKENNRVYSMMSKYLF